MTEGKKPEKTFRAGGVSATVWNNEGTKDGKAYEFKTVSIERNYKKGEEWGKTSTMKLNDLPKVALVAQQAYAYLFEKNTEEE